MMSGITIDHSDATVSGERNSNSLRIQERGRVSDQGADRAPRQPPVAILRAVG